MNSSGFDSSFQCCITTLYCLSERSLLTVLILMTAFASFGGGGDRRGQGCCPSGISVPCPQNVPRATSRCHGAEIRGARLTPSGLGFSNTEIILLVTGPIVSLRRRQVAMETKGLSSPTTSWLQGNLFMAPFGALL